MAAPLNPKQNISKLIRETPVHAHFNILIPIENQTFAGMHRTKTTFENLVRKCRQRHLCSLTYDVELLNLTTLRATRVA